MQTISPNTFNADDFLSNLIQGNSDRCSSISKQFLSQNPSILDLYEQVFKKSLYEIGRLWETNKISVATEHLATAITEGILNELFDQIISTKKKYNKKIILACVENEQHQVGIKMVGDIFEINGWESFFLGTSMPTNELINHIYEVKPDLVAISLSLYFNFKSLLIMVESLRKEFPDMTILLGGQAFKHGLLEINERFDKIVVLDDLYLLEKFIQSLNSSQ